MKKTYYVIQVTNSLGSVAYITGNTTPTEAKFPEVVMQPEDNRALRFESDNIYLDSELYKWLRWTYDRTESSQKITSITTKKIEIEEEEPNMKNLKKYYVIALMQKETYTDEVREVAWLRGFHRNTGRVEYSSIGSRTAFASADHKNEDYCGMFERFQMFVRNELGASYYVETKEIEVDEMEEKAIEQGAKQVLTGELIEHDFEEAYKELSQSYVLDDMVYDSSHVETYYNERSEAVKAFEGSWKFEADNEDQLKRLNQTLEREVRLKRYDEESISFEEYKELLNFINSITALEFQENKKDGMKLGKLLKRKGFSNGAVDYYSALDRKKEELYITITSAPQAIAGMSNHGKGWTSCQMTLDGGGEYNKHLLGSLSDDKLLLMVITKEPLTEWEAEMDDVILARSCAHVFNYDDVNVLVPIGVYSSAYHNAMNTGIKHLQSLGLKVLPTQNGNGGTRLTAQAEQADVSRYAYIYEEINEEIEVSCECPLCRGRGEYTTYINDYDEVEVECPFCHGSGEYETTIYIEETIEDEVEVESVIGSYEENGLSYGSRNKYMYVREEHLKAVLEL